MTNNNSGAEEGTIEVIVIEIYAKEDRTPPEGKHYEVLVDGKPYKFHHHHVTGKEILEKAGKTPIECFTLFEKRKHCEYEKVEPEQKVNLARHGVEHFKTEPPERFCFKVDTDEFHTHHKVLTPNQILEIAGLKPVTNYYLILIKPDGQKVNYKDKPTEPIHMTCPCMRFIAVNVGPTTVSYC
jgi:hypothetical protein